MQCDKKHYICLKTSFSICGIKSEIKKIFSKLMFLIHGFGKLLNPKLFLISDLVPNIIIEKIIEIQTNGPFLLSASFRKALLRVIMRWITHYLAFYVRYKCMIYSRI